ncbi:hypothetical protein ACHWQZ_G001685 [Mnemiopsis leidyi]
MGCGATKESRNKFLKSDKDQEQPDKIVIDHLTIKRSCNEIKKEENVDDCDKLNNVSMNKALLHEYLDRVTYKLEIERKEFEKHKLESSNYGDSSSKTNRNEDLNNRTVDKISKSLLKNYLKSVQFNVSGNDIGKTTFLESSS